MRKSKNKIAILSLSLLFALGSLQQLHAQPPAPPFDHGVNDGNTALPINGFIGIALAVGAYFGTQKLRNK